MGWLGDADAMKNSRPDDHFDGKNDLLRCICALAHLGEPQTGIGSKRRAQVPVASLRPLRSLGPGGWLGDADAMKNSRPDDHFDGKNDLLRCICALAHLGEPQTGIGSKRRAQVPVASLRPLRSLGPGGWLGDADAMKNSRPDDHFDGKNDLLRCI